MRAVILAMGLACLALAKAQDMMDDNGDRGPVVPGKDWPMFTPTENGDTFDSMAACTEIGALYCTACSNPGLLCYDCAAGSVLYEDNSGCKDCDTANCYDCEWNADGVTTTCEECYYGYMLMADGTCSACGTNCWECEPDDTGASSVCTECYSLTMPSVLTPAMCISCGTRCLSCAIATDDSVTCSTCESGYYVSDQGRCDSCPSFCETCSKPDSTKLCSACTGKYQVSTDQTKCLPCSTGCSDCAGESDDDSTRAKCTSCDADYYFATGSDQCTRCLDNCAECSEAGKCDVCNEGYFLADDAGSGCAECEWQCKVCSDATSCDECYPDYVNKDATSVVCDPCPANCITCTVAQAAAGECTTCADGYFRENNVCKKCSANCLDCDSATVCTDCATGYNLADDDACYKCPDNCFDDQTWCEYNTTVNKALCTNCAVGFAIDSDQTTCFACSTGCDDNCRYDNTNNAPECRCSDGTIPTTATNVALGQRGFCASTTDYACKAGYYYDDTLTVPDCVACEPSPGCTHCNATIDTHDCLDCDTSGYLAVPTAADECFACSGIHSKCVQCSSTTVCTSCSEGYGLSEGSCKACGSLCATCSFTGTGSAATSTCTGCKTNAFQNPDVAANCLSCVSPCNDCDVNTDGATICLSGGCNNRYVFKDDTCVACPDNCNVCEFNGDDQLTCVDGDCDANFGNVGLECQPCPQDCSSCSVSTAADSTGVLLCDTCASGFEENDLPCTPCPSNCPTCAEADGSVSGLTAAIYYYVNADSECERCPGNCQTCSASSCSLCDDGYGLSTDRKTCVGCGILTGVDNCVDCDSADSTGVANCFECAGGYVLSDDSSTCNLVSVLGAKCTRTEDHYPECDGDNDGHSCDGEHFLKTDDDGENIFEYPKECLIECYSCGTVDHDTGAILTGSDAECNPKEDANYTSTEPCYDGVCGVLVQKVDGDRTMAARGCIRNASYVCDDSSERNRIACRGDAGTDQTCLRCCNGNACNDQYFSGSGIVYASIAVLLVALANALSLK